MSGGRIAQGREIRILCEGETEVIAVKYFIRRQWIADGLEAIGLHPVDLRGRLKDIFDRVPLYRRIPDIVAVFTLIDLYELNQVTYSRHTALSEKVAQAKAWLRNDFDASYFFPHISVHEIEAWLLAEGACLSQRLKDPKIQADPKAEEKNFNNPPHKRIDDIFKKRRSGNGYHKINGGTPLFRCVEFAPVYKTCRYFREFYDELKFVGQVALKQN